MILQNKLLRIFLSFVLLNLASVINSCKSESDIKQINLEPFAIIDQDIDIEVSGLVQSRTNLNTFWLHGDAGDEAAIFLINKGGASISADKNEGIRLSNSDNEDWEDIATDNDGNLYVGDIGNNCECRTDLSILGFREPDPSSKTVNQVSEFKFEYSTKFKSKKGKNMTPDAEALFYQGDSFYLLTKESNGKNTGFYKLSDPDPNTVNIFELVQNIDFDDKVTGADITPSGDALAILTSSSIWLMTDFEGNDFFSGTIQKVFFESQQVESIAFSNDSSLIVAEENGLLYEAPLSVFN
jgi:hypothetical protein